MSHPMFHDFLSPNTHHLLKEAFVGRDGGELFLEAQIAESLRFEDNVLKDATYHQTQGFGLRLLSGSCSLYAHSPHLTHHALQEATSALHTLSPAAGSVIEIKHAHTPYPAHASSPRVSFKDKVSQLERMNAFARALDPRVVQVSLSWGLRDQDILVQRPDHPDVGDKRIYATLTSMITVEDKGRREYGYVSLGRKKDTDFMDEAVWQRQLKEALRKALVSLESIPAPAGAMPVVLGHGITGILLHEAVGHGLEADFNRKGHSVFSKKMGHVVASPLVTIIDDGRPDIGMPHHHGSLTIDDEGTPTQKNTLIDQGVVCGYMSDVLNAHLMGQPSSGNGRRQGYAHMPMPRMTNTYMAPGTSAPEDMIASIDKGIYAVGFGGGQVDIVSGNFVFASSEAYLIEKGKKGPPIKNATLIGNGPDVMKKIAMVGNDLTLDPGVGYCGKAGQSVLVGLGQPSCLVSEMTVGGAQT